MIPTMRTLMMMLTEAETNVPFLNHLRDAVEASEAGFHYEEGGCWGMALALYDAFNALGQHPQLVITSNDGHALVQVDGRLYDYSGDVTESYSDVTPTTRAGLMRAALKSGWSAYDVRGDAIAAAEIIETAKRLGIVNESGDANQMLDEANDSFMEGKEPKVFSSLHDVEVYAYELRVSLDVHEDSDNIHFNWIERKPRSRKGNGGKVIEALCSYADRVGKQILLQVEDADIPLREYYARYGFEILDYKRGYVEMWRP